MAYCSREFDVPAREVFECLIDPTTYPSWLIGAAHIRSIDPDWPLVGQRFHHRIGIGPLSVPDSTSVLAIEPDHLLRLAVRVRPLVSAVVDFRLVGENDHCVLTMQEEPAPRALGNAVRPLLDPLTHVRNHLSLKRLADVVRERSSGGDTSGSAP